MMKSGDVDRIGLSFKSGKKFTDVKDICGSYRYEPDVGS